MLKEKMTYGYGDVYIQPAMKTTIDKISDCNVLKDGMLPIFTAPMGTVVSEKNAQLFEYNRVIPVIPRNIEWKDRMEFMRQGKWVACSLSEFSDLMLYENGFDFIPHIVIVAEAGNSSRMIRMCREAKSKYGMDRIAIMAGNIANPATYAEYCKAGIDYVRCGIGAGSTSILSSNTGMHYGIASLLDEISVRREKISRFMGIDPAYRCVTKVVADGGIRSYGDVVKALALGADYVMIGGVFASLIESCAPTFYYDKEGGLHTVDPFDENVSISHIDNDLFSYTIDAGEEGSNHIIQGIRKVFYGTGSRRGQEDLYGEKTHTASGIQKDVPCGINLSSWVQNMTDYLATAMSLCNVKDVSSFNQETVNTFIASNTLRNSINE